MHSKKFLAVVVLISGLSQLAIADCQHIEEQLKLDPVEVGFCESDAVFIGKSNGAVETIGGFTPDGSTTTKHFRIQRSQVQVAAQFKNTLPKTITMIADIYAKDAYVFEAGNTYLIFAKRLANESEYAGAPACSLQPTLRIEDADKVLKQLQRHKSGQQKIDCTNIRHRTGE